MGWPITAAVEGIGLAYSGPLLFLRASLFGEQHSRRLECSRSADADDFAQQFGGTRVQRQNPATVGRRSSTHALLCVQKCSPPQTEQRMGISMSGRLWKITHAVVSPVDAGLPVLGHVVMMSLMH
jgi:hypothetical protein